MSAVLVNAPAPTVSTPSPVRPPSGHHRVALRAARAFGEALFSTADGPPPKERMDWLIGELDDYLTLAGWRSAGVYKLGLLATCFIAPLLFGRLKPLWSLTLDKRVRALQKMERTPLALVVLGLKSIICTIYYEHPDAAREIGYSACTSLPREVTP